MKKLLMVFVLFGLAAGGAQWFMEQQRLEALTPEQRAAEEAARTAAALEQNRLAEIEQKEHRRQAEVRAENEAKKSAEVRENQEPFLQELVKLEGIDEARFTGRDTIQVRFKPLVHIGKDHVRVMCEGIAKLWASRVGLSHVRVESWYGNEMYAKGTYEGPVPEDYMMKKAVGALADYEQKREAMTEQANVAMRGKTMAEIEGVHGPARSRDPITGWAEWAKFKARFRDGKVFDVEAY